MRIATMIINGFRCFGPIPVEITFTERLNCFIGANSVGKTTALEAFKKMFGTYQEQQFFKEDFHVPLAGDPALPGPKTLFIEVIIYFDRDKEAIPDFFHHLVLQMPKANPYVRIRLEGTWIPSTMSQQGDIDSELYFIYSALGTDPETENKIPFPKDMRKLLQVIYVPAIRRPGEQLKFVSGTVFHRLLHQIDYGDDFKIEFAKHFVAINTLLKEVPEVDVIQQGLQQLWTKFHKDIRYSDSHLHFGNGELSAVLKKLEVHFTPGPSGERHYQIDDLGDGYQSLFYLTLVCTLLNIESSRPLSDEILEVNRPLLTILCIEEPENHIAPQLLGRVMRILNEIAAKENTQVFISSHTPAIVKRIAPQGIQHFRMQVGASIVNQIELPPKSSDAYKYVQEAVHNYPEIYFAKLVVIGEGDTEQVIFNRLMRTFNADFDDNMISFAPLGGRFVNHIWKLLHVLGIPFVTLLDLDLQRPGGGWGRIKYVLGQLLASGADRNQLLKNRNGVFNDEWLEVLHKRVLDNTTKKNIAIWMKRLQSYNVFFSSPLDLDFLMLEAFSSFYTDPKVYPDGEGPDIPKKKSAEYNTYIEGAVKATLKQKSINADRYTNDQQELMIWYRYLFLGRGKPVTHVQALSLITDEDTFDNNLPPVLREIFIKIESLLND
jgi:hypothetical protein